MGKKAAILFIAAVIVFICFIVNDPYDNPFNFTGMGIIGGIGIISAITCFAFEGCFMVPLKGLLVCSVMLVLAMEIPMTTPLLVISYVFCIYLMSVSYGGRIAPTVLGSIAVICLPFWGVILIIFVKILFNGFTRRSNSSRK